MEKKERQREVDTGAAKADAESFITESYRKQMEINNQESLAVKIEE